MKFAFGVPAWLGAIKVSVVLFGIPGLLAILSAAVASSTFGISRWANVGVALLSFVLLSAVWFVLLVAFSRRKQSR